MREEEFREEMAQKELELKLERRKRELDLLRKKREDEMAVISARNQAEVAQLEHEILGQEAIEGKDNNDQISKVSKTSPSLKHYLVPSSHAITEDESKDNFSSSRVELSTETTVTVSQPTSGTSQSSNVSTPLTNSVIWSSSPGPALSPWSFQNSNTSTPSNNFSYLVKTFWTCPFRRFR